MCVIFKVPGVITEISIRRYVSNWGILFILMSIKDRSHSNNDKRKNI